jgi:homoserine dehydrogenase
VDDVFNAIMVRGDATGDVMFYGKGAGKLPTASAVVADMIDCVKHLNARKYIYWGAGAPDYVEDYRAEERAVYVHAKAADIETAYTQVGDLFGCVQVLDYPDAPAHEIAFITPKAKVGEIEEKIKSLSMQIEPINVFWVCD